MLDLLENDREPVNIEALTGALRYPDLICIGSQKAGTTWLHRMLAGHPDVHMPVMKEIHYFDTLHVPGQANFQKRRSGRARRLLQEQVGPTVLHRAGAFFLSEIVRHQETRRYLRELRFAAGIQGVTLDDAWYASLFADAPPDGLTCDFTTSYALLPAAGIEHLRRLNRDARILYIVRDPVERALSHARMLVARNRAPPTIEMVRRYLRAWSVRSRDDSVEVIDRWRRYWPAAQFRVLFFDDIRERPLKLLEEVCRFAGLPYDEAFFPHHRRIIYQGPRKPIADELKPEIIDKFGLLLAELKRRYPAQTKNWGKSAMPSTPEPKSANFGRRLFRAAAATCVCVGLAGGGYIGLLQVSGNFHTVVPGELYRAAQPSARQLVAYAQQYGLRTVVNLCGDAPGKPWYDAEVAAAQKLGLTHIDFRMSARHVVPQDEAERLVTMLKSAPKPILVHCSAGADRSGLASALYVAAVKQLGEEAAEHQLSFFYGHISLPLASAFAMDRSFEALEPWLGYHDS